MEGPAAGPTVASAIASAEGQVPLPSSTAVVEEISLTGEIRSPADWSTGSRKQPEPV
jgi:predicted ATP-dependent serine protease